MRQKYVRLLFLSIFLLLPIFFFTAPVNPRVLKKHQCQHRFRHREYSIHKRHWLYDIVPRHRQEIPWYEVGSWLTWALFGNDDDGVFGEMPKAGHWTRQPISLKRAIEWQLRNPFHNFCYYVIGSAYLRNSEFAILKLSKENLEVFQYHKAAKTVFAGKGTGIFLGLHGWKPFLSIRIDYGRLFDFYIGWRERGNFGFKLNPCKKKPTPHT